jgi:membrane associated rhomboid family serine protease
VFLPLTTSERLQRRPWVTGALAILCTVFFIHSRWRLFLIASELKGASHEAIEEATRNELLKWAFVTPAQPIHLVTYLFAHADWMHLLGNVFFLVMFGRVVEARWGKVLLAMCFFSTGIAGGLLQYAASAGDPRPLVGASGAIMGIAGALIVALPNARFNRLISPLFWPATPIVALARGEGWRALAELVPVYGWVLRLKRGVPALFVLPAWLSIDLMSMLFSPVSHVSYACHVGGAFAGIGLAALVRATQLDKKLDAITSSETTEETPDPTLSPAVQRMRTQNRASQWPTSRISAVWLVGSLAIVVALFIGSAKLGDYVSAYRYKIEAQRYRDKLLASRNPAEDMTEQTYSHELFTLKYPTLFWACAPGGNTDGPCAGTPSGPAKPNFGSLMLVHPEVGETVHVLAIRGGVDKRSDLVEAFAKDVAARATKVGAQLHLVSTSTGKCHGEWSIESVQEIGDGEGRALLSTCTFTRVRDLYLFAYVIPNGLRERDETFLQQLLGRVELPVTKEKSLAVAADVIPFVEAPKPPPPGGGGSSDDEPTECPKGQTAYRVDGKLHCAANEAPPPLYPPPYPPPLPRTFPRRR